MISGYGLVFGGLLMLLGRAADLAGRRRVLMAGFALFGGASLACGLAQSPAALLAARAVQGLGAAAVSPAALALLTAAVPEGPRRTKALGVWTAAAAGGGALGWVLGGVLTEQAGWEWVFLVNVAPCALGLLLAPRLLPESRGARHGRLDVPGALTVTAGLALLVLGLTRAEQAGIADASTWGSLLAAALLLGAFARIERRAEHPLLPPGTLADRRLSGALVAAVVITAASTGPLFLVVLHLQDDLGLAPTEAGLLFTPVNLAVIGGSMAGARALERRGAPFMLTAGLALLGAGVLALLGPLPLPVALIAIGAGIGAASLASTEAGTAAAGDERQGLASGLLNTAAQLGQRARARGLRPAGRRHRPRGLLSSPPRPPWRWPPSRSGYRGGHGVDPGHRRERAGARGRRPRGGRALLRRRARLPRRRPLAGARGDLGHGRRPHADRAVAPAGRPGRRPRRHPRPLRDEDRRGRLRRGGVAACASAGRT